MIGYIKGSVTYLQEDRIVLENNGIGYQIYTSNTTLQKLTNQRNDVKVFTYLHVREDELSLFGFLSKEELDTFQLLISVNGIGPKAALAILSVLSVQELTYAVMAGDTKAITKANGVGAKGANRVIMELKDKLKIEDVLDAGLHGDDAISLQKDTGADAVSDTVLALVSLGYSETEALRAVRQVEGASLMNPEDLLKNALKKLF
ncbi:MAG: Holliday junction branch migration protein RuvA [Lachnospiraceae bacterium]